MQTETLDAAAVETSPTPRGAGDPWTAAVRPEIKRLAHQLGVDLASLAGSRPDGTIRRADVLRAAGDVTGLVRPPLAALEERRETRPVAGAAVRR
jgi:pyruvate dehydrogenase E2 component (dihydrolipoamide acetyltransferase)